MTTVKAGKKKKKPPLGTGERFRNLVEELKAKGARDPKALAAWIGRKNLGKGKMQALAAAGRRKRR